MNKSRICLNHTGYGWKQGFGFFAINDWIDIPGLGRYTNVEKNVPIPGTNLTGLKIVTS